jgi:hypothetical protein
MPEVNRTPARVGPGGPIQSALPNNRRASPCPPVRAELQQFLLHLNAECHQLTHSSALLFGIVFSPFKDLMALSDWMLSSLIRLNGSVARSVQITGSIKVDNLMRARIYLFSPLQ